MKIRHLAFAVLAAAAVAGCSDDGPTFVNREPQAYIRYVNASPDSPTLDVRFIDRAENVRSLFDIGFRGNSGQYQSVNAGDRQLRAFLAAVTGRIDSVSTVMLDAQFTLEPDAYYTLLQTGRVGTGVGTANNNATLTVIRDDLPASVPTGQIAVRVLHAISGAGAVDVAVNPSATTEGPVTTTFQGAAFGVPSAYSNLPVLSGTSLYRFIARPAGNTTTTVANSVVNLPGIVGTPASIASPALDPTAGVRQAQSVLTAVVFPAAVAGSPAASTATASPSVLLLQDRNPPRISQ